MPMRGLGTRASSPRQSEIRTVPKCTFGAGGRINSSYVAPCPTYDAPLNQKVSVTFYPTTAVTI